MKGWTAVLIFVCYTAAVFGLLYGMLVLAGHYGLGEHATTLVAALGGALVGSLGPALTAVLNTAAERRSTDERIRDEASRVALELTRMDYDLRREAESDGPFTEVLAPAKVYREFYTAVADLRTKGTWPKAVEDLGLLNVFRIATDRRSQQRR